MVRVYYESQGRSNETAFWANVIFSLFIYINGMTNLYKMRMANVSGKKLSTKIKKPVFNLALFIFYYHVVWYEVYNDVWNISKRTLYETF